MTKYNENGVRVNLDVRSTDSYDAKDPHVTIYYQGYCWKHVFLREARKGDLNIHYSWRSLGPQVQGAIQYCLDHEDELCREYSGR